jgi:hypothetical protein
MTTNKLRFTIYDPDTPTTLAAGDALVIDAEALTLDQIDRAEDMAWMDKVPADVLETGLPLVDLIADGLRWRAYMATPYTRSTLTRGDAPLLPVDLVRCPACDLAGDAPRWIDPRTALVVPWDVLGDARPYALVCPEHETEVTA